MNHYINDPEQLALIAAPKEAENDGFTGWLQAHGMDVALLDAQVHRIYQKVEAGIDCTQCGNCCNSLIIDVSAEEITRCASAMEISGGEFKEKYIEESQQGRCFISSIPCHFFADKKCTIYDLRFADCREFPHLHKPDFLKRLLGTLLHYTRCPIIYHTIEELKTELDFGIVI